MPGLQRIILIDTHLPDVVELKLRGHTNICGTNASGKTTLQRLIPVFYGEYPSRVVPATRDNFETWYLPRTTSHIIYEYTTHDEVLCQAVLSSTGVGVNYRFIGKPFEKDDYLKPQKQGLAVPIPMADVARSLKRNHVMVSSQLSTKDFRGVIQNDQSVLTQSSQSRELIGYSRVFSLTSATHPLRHIEKLAKAVHSKEGKMETIKTMIAAIMEEDGVQPPVSNLSRQRVDDWMSECQLIAAFEDVRPQFLALEQVYQGLDDAQLTLLALQEVLVSDERQLDDDATALQRTIETSQHDLTREETLFQDAQDTLNQTISASRADVERTTTELDGIEDEYNDWQDKDIDALQEKIAQLPQWQQQLSDASKRLALVTEKHQDAESRLHQRIAELSEDSAAQLEVLEEQRQQLNDELADVVQQASQAELSIKQRFQAEKAKLDDAHHTQLLQLEVDKTQANTTLQNAGFSPFEQSQLDLLDASIKEAQSIEDASQDLLRTAQKSLQSAQNERESCNRTLENKRSECVLAQQAVDKQKDLLFPGEGTLLEFLRDSLPDWSHTLGKVVRPELLGKTDLKPEVISTSESKQGLFGVSVDLSHLPEPQEGANEQQLQAALAQAEQALQNCVTEQNSAEQALAKANETVRQTELQLTKQENSVSAAQANRKRYQRDRDTLLSEYQQALQERKRAFEKRKKQLESDLAKFKKTYQADIEECDAQLRDAVSEHQFHWQQVQEEARAKLTTVSSQIAAVKQHAEDEKSEITRLLEQELQSDGVDIDELGQLKKRIKQLKQNIEETERNRHLTSDYQRWYDTVFKKQKVVAQTTLESARQTLSDAQRELANKERAYKNTRESLRSIISNSDSQLTKNKQDADSVRRLQKGINKLELPENKGTEILPTGELANKALSQRISLGESALVEYDDREKSVRDYVDMFDQLIASQAGTGLSDTWEKSRQECTEYNEEGFASVNHRKLVPHLSQLLNVIVPQKLEGLREQGKIFGTDLIQYYHVLSDIDGRIARQSKRLTDEVDKELYLDGVSESAVKIRSRISELEFWPQLEAFKSEYDSWIKTGTHALPQTQYGETMRAVIDILGRAALTGGISKLLDIELRLKEGNSHLVVRTDRQLNESSSHGMAYLILCKFLLAFTRLLRANDDVIIHWPIDELGTLHQNNIKKIFAACQNNHIAVVGAFPNPESDVLKLFENRYLIDKQTKRLQVVQPKVSKLSEKLKAKRVATEEVKHG